MASAELEELEHQLHVIRAWIQKYADWRRSEPDPYERAKYQDRIRDLQRRERLRLAKISWHHSANRIAQWEKILSSPAIDSAPPIPPYLNLSRRQLGEKLLQEDKDNMTRQAEIFQNAHEMPLWNKVFDEFPKKWMTPESVEMGLRVPTSTASRKKKGKAKPVGPQVERLASVHASLELSRHKRVDEFLRHVLRGESNRTQFYSVAGVDPADARRWQRSEHVSERVSDSMEGTLKMTRDKFNRKWNDKKR